MYEAQKGVGLISVKSLRAWKDTKSVEVRELKVLELHEIVIARVL